MDQIFPTPIPQIDPTTVLRDSMMSRRNLDRQRPWVFANMIMSADGAFARAGRSGGLGGPADKAMFHTLRAMADAILVGAGTARAERYRRPSSDEETTRARQERGQEAAPRLALISRSGHVPEDQPFLDGHGPDPLVFLPASNLAQLDSETNGRRNGVEYRAAGDTEVDLGDVLGQLSDESVGLVLCEGGPQLLGDLAAGGLLDQIFITVSPQFVAGDHTGLLGSRPELEADLTLEGVIEADSYLLLNYAVSH